MGWFPSHPIGDLNQQQNPQHDQDWPGHVTDQFEQSDRHADDRPAQADTKAHHGPGERAGQSDHAGKQNDAYDYRGKGEG